MSSSSSRPRLLPESFVPTDDHVIICRGKRSIEHEGNKRLRKLVKSKLPEYLAANKGDKSVILLLIVRQIRQNNKDEIGFVKEDPITEGRWLELTELASRVAVGQVFRDALNNTYKSSRVNKRAKKRAVRKAMLDNSLPTSTTVAGATSYATTRIMGNHIHQMQTPLVPNNQSTCYINTMFLPSMRHQGPMMMNMMPFQNDWAMRLPNMMVPVTTPPPTPKLIGGEQQQQPEQQDQPQASLFPTSTKQEFEPLPLDFVDSTERREEEDGATTDPSSQDSFIDIFHSTSLSTLTRFLGTTYL